MGSAHHAVGEVDDSRGQNHATVGVPYWSETHMNETSISLPLGVARYTTVIGLDWSMSEYGSVLDTMAGELRSQPSDDQLPALPCQAAATSTGCVGPPPHGPGSTRQLSCCERRENWETSAAVMPVVGAELGLGLDDAEVGVTAAVALGGWAVALGLTDAGLHLAAPAQPVRATAAMSATNRTGSWILGLRCVAIITG